jgi:C1A family cysteine protease
MNFKVSRYGWIPDLPDHRDYLYAAPAEVAAALPVSVDLRAQIRDGIKSVGKQGDCPETKWPYVISKFKTKPFAKCYSDALKYKAVLYQGLTPVLSQLKGCLASGYLFVFGFTVYESFESAQVAKTGHASLPKSGEQSIGGHAVMCVGYDDAKQWFIVRNSWGNKWGMKGYFTLPYSYLISANLAATSGQSASLRNYIY